MAYAASTRRPAASSRPSRIMMSAPPGPSSAGLEHEHHVAGELVAQLVQDAGRADQARRRAGRARTRASVPRGWRRSRGRGPRSPAVRPCRRAAAPPGARADEPASRPRHAAPPTTERQLLAHGDLEVEPVERLQDQALGDRQLAAQLGHLVQPAAQVDQVVGRRDSASSRSAHRRNASTAPRRTRARRVTIVSSSRRSASRACASAALWCIRSRSRASSLAASWKARIERSAAPARRSAGPSARAPRRRSMRESMCTSAARASRRRRRA